MIVPKNNKVGGRMETFCMRKHSHRNDGSRCNMKKSCVNNNKLRVRHDTGTLRDKQSRREVFSSNRWVFLSWTGKNTRFAISVAEYLRMVHQHHRQIERLQLPFNNICATFPDIVRLHHEHNIFGSCRKFIFLLLSQDYMIFVTSSRKRNQKSIVCREWWWNLCENGRFSSLIFSSWFSLFIWFSTDFSVSMGL